MSGDIDPNDAQKPISKSEIQQRFQKSIEDLIDYYAREYDVTVGEIVGVIETVKIGFIMDQYNEEEDEGNIA